MARRRFEHRYVAVQNAIKGDILEHFDPFRSTLSQSHILEHFDPFRSTLRQSHTAQEMVTYQECQNQEQNGAGGPPILVL